ncbi:metallophosphoesterase family protein [Nitrospirota bacterium]
MRSISRGTLGIIILFIVVILSIPGCGPTSTPDTKVLSNDQNFTFAVIGDYGTPEDSTRAVADLVKSWAPDFIITSGDNSYPFATEDVIDMNIGQYYHGYIYPYKGSYGSGARFKNRFFPTLGNHDWPSGPYPEAYLEYFTLPGNERYYDFVWGPVHFFVLDSDDEEPDGTEQDSIQAQWFKERIATSTSTFKFVNFHQPPYSSGNHGSLLRTQWPYEIWGVDVVFSGHDHTYERLMKNNVLYFVNGLGGKSIYHFNTPLPESQVRYNGDYGAMLVQIASNTATFSFYNISAQLIDTITITK